MAYSGSKLPGIMSPDENIHDFAELYGNGNLGMMLMASAIANSCSQPEKPRFKEAYNSQHFPNFNHPTFVDDRNPRNGLQPSSGSRAMRHGGYGNQYHPRHSEGFDFPRASQGSRSMSHEGHGDQYYQGVYPQLNQYSFPAPPRYAWL